MKIDRLPPQKPHRSPFKDTTMEQQGELFRISRAITSDFTLEGLQQWVEEGRIQSYSREGDRFIIYSSDSAMLEAVARLPKSKLPHPWVEKAKEIFLPPNMKENVAPEYLQFRAWALGGSVCGAAIGFANLSVTMDATKIALGTTEKIVMAQTINTYAWRLTSMGASFMGQRGDQDPRRYYTINNMVSMSNAFLTLGILSAIPTAYVPLSFATSVAGAVGSSLGGAANVNIFNHMAKNNKGLVQSKNSVQDLVVSMLGTPLALGIRWGANRLGLNPTWTTVGLLGPLQAFCSLNAAAAIRMEPISRGEMESAAEHYLQHGAFPEAPPVSVLGNLKSLFVSPPDVPTSEKLTFTDKLEDVVAGNPNAKELFSTFGKDRYMLSLDPLGKKVTAAVRRDAQFDDVFRAFAQARALEQSLAHLLPAVERIVGEVEGPNALVELVHRALAAPTGSSQGMAEQGWHNNTLGLELPVLQGEWKGEEPPALPPISRSELVEQMALPDEAKLRRWLGKQ